MVVQADLSDPTWRGTIKDSQRQHPAYCFTDIYLGQVMYFAPDVGRFGNPAIQIGVFGHLSEMAKAVLAEPSSETRVGSYCNEWYLDVRRQGPVTLLQQHDGPEFGVDHGELRAELALVIAHAVGQVVWGHRGDRCHPFVRDVEALGVLLEAR